MLVKGLPCCEERKVGGRERSCAAELKQHGEEGGRGAQRSFPEELKVNL